MEDKSVVKVNSILLYKDDKMSADCINALKEEQSEQFKLCLAKSYPYKRPQSCATWVNFTDDHEKIEQVEFDFTVKNEDNYDDHKLIGYD